MEAVQPAEGHPEARAFDRALMPKVLLSAEVWEERISPVGNGIYRRDLLMETRSETVPVLLREKWDGHPAEANAVPIRWEAMLADRILLEIEHHGTWRELREKAEANGWRLERTGPATRLARLRTETPGLDSLEAAAAILASLPGEPPPSAPDHLHFPLAQPNDPFYHQQWAFPRINGPGAWAVTTGSAETVVAVIDSGADLSHPDLVGNFWQNPNENPDNLLDDDGNGYLNDIVGWDFFDGNNDPSDLHGHGTHVAGIIGAVGNNGLGITGTAWNTGMIILRVGSETFATSRIISALDYVSDLRTNRGIPVVAINNSYGAYSRNPLFERAVERTRRAGILFVAAAGNDGVNMDTGGRIYPAAYGLDNIIGVAATTSTDGLWTSSNHASFIHLGAPGQGIYSTERGAWYGNRQGTSMATPFVTGTLALMATANPSLEWADLKRHLLDSVDPLPSLSGKTATGGRLNMGRAVAAAATRTGELVVVQPSVPRVRQAELSNRLILALDWQGEAPGPDAGDVEWETVSGPVEAIFHHLDPFSATAFFPAEGDYVLRAVLPQGLILSVSDPVYVKAGTGPLATEGLAAYWNFDDITGNVALDASGENRHGNLLQVELTDGYSGAGIRLDGNKGRMEFAPPATPDITLSAWVRPEGRGNSIFPRVFDLPEFVFFTGRDGAGAVANRNNIKFSASRSLTDGVWHTPPPTIVDGEWQHLAVTFQAGRGNDWPAIYLNGTPLPVEAQVIPVGNRRAATGTAAVGNTLDESRTWEGRLDEMRIHRRILSEVEIKALAFEASIPVISGLIPAAETALQANQPGVLLALADGPGEPHSFTGFTWIKKAGPGEVVFSPGESPEKTSAVFSLPGAYSLTVLGQTPFAEVEADLQVDVGEDVPVVRLDSTEQRVLRGSHHPVTVTVSSDRILSAPLTVHLASESSAPTDTFLQGEGVPAFLTLPAGGQSATFTLVPLPDSDGEDEDIGLLIQLSPGTGYTMGNPREVEMVFSPLRFAHWVEASEGHLPSGETIGAIALADANGNGISRLMEYALGFPATGVFPSRPLPQAGLARIDGATFPTMSFTRPIDIRDVIYLFEVAEKVDAAIWTDGDELVEILETVDHGNGMETITVRDRRPIDSLSDARFFRLRVVLP